MQKNTLSNILTISSITNTLEDIQLALGILKENLVRTAQGSLVLQSYTGKG